MKKLFAMSLFALSTTAMFGGNIERIENITTNEKTDQIAVKKCYRFEVYSQYFVNHNPTSNMVLVYDYTGYFTEAEFQIKSDELYATYVSTLNNGSNNNGTGDLFLHGHYLAPAGSCFSVAQ